MEKYEIMVGYDSFTMGQPFPEGIPCEMSYNSDTDLNEVVIEDPNILFEVSNDETQSLVSIISQSTNSKCGPYQVGRDCQLSDTIIILNDCAIDTALLDQGFLIRLIGTWLDDVTLNVEQWYVYKDNLSVQCGSHRISPYAAREDITSLYGQPTYQTDNVTVWQLDKSTIIYDDNIITISGEFIAGDVVSNQIVDMNETTPFEGQSDENGAGFNINYIEFSDGLILPNLVSVYTIY